MRKILEFFEARRNLSSVTLSLTVLKLWPKNQQTRKSSHLFAAVSWTAGEIHNMALFCIVYVRGTWTQLWLADTRCGARVVCESRTMLTFLFSSFFMCFVLSFPLTEEQFHTSLENLLASFFLSFLATLEYSH